jgi:hypothetical protein
MPILPAEKREYRVLYFISYASRMAENKLNTWGVVAENVTRAEGVACQGPGMEKDCAEIQKFVEKHQGLRQKPVGPELGQLRTEMQNRHSNPRSMHARHAGLWLGYAGGTCELLRRFPQKPNAPELRDHLRTSRENLFILDPELAGHMKDIEAMAAKDPPDHQKILKLIEAFVFRIN